MALNNYMDSISPARNSLIYDNNFGTNVDRPYVRGMTTFLPQPMAGNITQDDLYPLQSSLQTPQLNSPVNTPNVQSFAKGGKVENKKTKSKDLDFMNPYPSLAEMIRQQGGEEDVILAHINPLEAEMLSVLSQGGRTNPITGLPQFGFFDSPGKWFKSVAGPATGMIIGNMILPGLGGIIGGALGGAAASKIRGRKDIGQAALRGAAMATMAPSLSSIAGAGASHLGLSQAGQALTNYGAQNAILPSLGLTSERLSGLPSSLGFSGMPTAGSQMPGEQVTSNSSKGMDLNLGKAAVQATGEGENPSWLGKWLEPKNALTALTVAGAFANRPKKETPEKKGADLALQQKAYEAALQLSPQERALKEADLLGEKQMLRRLERNKYLAEERFNVNKIHRRTHDPDEYERTKKWFSYYDNPAFHGNPLLMAHGGSIPQMMIPTEVPMPEGLGRYLSGPNGGQEDIVPIKGAQGEFIIPADVVAHAGDGNNEAGAKKFELLIANLRKAKGTKNKLPPKAKSLIHYMKK